MTYRNLIGDEALRSRSQPCLADDQGKVAVAEEFSTEFVHHTRFSSEVRLGVFQLEFTLPGGIRKHSGSWHVTFHNVMAGNNCRIENIQDHIANCEIRHNAFIENVSIILVDGLSKFGNDAEMSVLNETGGREIPVSGKLSAYQAYIVTLYRYRPKLIARMREITNFHSNKHASAVGPIGSHIMILNTGSIKSARTGNCCHICDTCRLCNGSINNNEIAPVHISRDVAYNNFIISSGSYVGDGTMLVCCFVGQVCKLGHNYSVSDPLSLSNCQGENGETCATSAGPYTAIHYKSTLLIAGMSPFMNANSGSNQSSHVHKLGPIHQGTLKRGAKTTSDSCILQPTRVGAFSLVVGCHVNHSDTSSPPFSYLIEQDNTTYLVPGVNLCNVNTIRDAQKWPKRDQRTDTNKLDFINYNLLSLYTVQKMFKGQEMLKNLHYTSGEPSDIYSFHSTKIRDLALVKSIGFYETAIHKFLGNSVIKYLEDTGFQTNEKIRVRLKPDTPIGSGKRVDIPGLIVSKSGIDALTDGIESGTVNRSGYINAELEWIRQNYYIYEWVRAYDKLGEFYGINPERITTEDIIHIVEGWKEAVAGLDRMVYKDVEKGFFLTSVTELGADGSRLEKELDFEQVRGDLESNPFVAAVLKHIEVKTTLGDKLTGYIQHVR